MEIKVTKIVAVGPVEKSTTGFYRALTIELETGARHPFIIRRHLKRELLAVNVYPDQPIRNTVYVLTGPAEDQIGYYLSGPGGLI